MMKQNHNNGTLGYPVPVQYPSFMKSGPVIPIPVQKPAESNSLNVYPNPAKDYVILAYDLEKTGGATLDVHDISAKPKFTGNLTGKQDQITIDTRGWKAGAYIATLKINGKAIESLKFTVID